MSRNDHSDVEDWAPAALQEALDVLDDWLQEASVVIIVVIVILVAVPAVSLPLRLLARLPVLRDRRSPSVALGGVGEWLLSLLRGEEDAVVGGEGGHGVEEVGHFEEVEHLYYEQSMVNTILTPRI